MHLMKSSSMPPAVVTSTSTMRFWTRYLQAERRGEGRRAMERGGVRESEGGEQGGKDTAQGAS